ncbi:uncharacterized protein MKZ38_009156 [Zalerion maritima]|uniref:TM7S3/TM198-like domain-containing protein n=1 Tax=Zalerion maritima TaxID=339359 RepID=A0AAD5RGK4_9PEZI|nr:uncharacterized protein MKZ38_009156 [Zalerion maritima]
MLPGGSLSRALICLLLLFNLAAAGVLRPVRRQEETTAVSTSESTATTESDAEQTGTDTNSDEESTGTATTESAKETESKSASSSVTVSTSVPTLLPSSDSDNNSSDDDGDLYTTTEAGQLPLEPELTPGWGVAGAFLLITGVGYALIGIKNQWVHTLLSTAYLGALGTSVLIIYLMTLPVSDGVQGGYVVAAILTGAILGGGACIFKEITEGLGCMLGGFCFSMWLLTLTEGGLLKASGSKAIFICAFTAGGFATYFSQYTRAYGLIASISFSGATVVILGIDCFSRAGLKEFWAYIWGLNEDLFPIDTNTYPLTRGIKAETAIIIIIFVVGIVSQMQLWKVIKEHRDKRAAERAADQRDLQEEEEAVGRQIEEQNARERRRWEAVYGDGDGEPSSPTARSGDSGVGSVNEKRGTRNSQMTSTDKLTACEEVIEMSDLQTPEEGTPDVPPKPKTAAEMVTEVNQDGTLTVRVATDDDITGGAPTETEHEKNWVVGPDGNPIPASEAPKRMSRHALPPPIVVPLPFKVPEGAGGENQSVADRSSVATFNDEEDNEQDGPALLKRRSMAKRLSRSSATLLRRMSQKTTKHRLDSPLSPAGEDHVSNEELIIPRRDVEDDRRSSLAATVDGLSTDGDARSRDGRPISIEINAALAERAKRGEQSLSAHMDEVWKSTTGNDEEMASPEQEKYGKAAQLPLISKDRPLSGASLGPSDSIGEKTSAVGKPSRASLSPDEAKNSKSIVSESSTPASLTKDRLPRALSRVALSYRTNEWAKHLSHAETPEPETLQLNEYPAEVDNTDRETAAPIDVSELQLTAENGAPPPARPASAMSQKQIPRSVSRSSTLQPAPQSGSPSNSNNPYQTPRHVSNSRRVSTDVLNQPIAEEGTEDGGKRTASPMEQDALPSCRTSTSNDLPPVQGVVSYSSPQTLIGKREMLVRNKSMLSVPGTQAAQGNTTERPPSEVGSLHNYPLYAAYANASPNADDLPLSQRREIMMRQNSLQALAGGIARSPSATPSTYGQQPGAAMSTPALAADSVPFNSHQPQRDSGLPSHNAREARLASFRQSVATDLRNGSPIVPVNAKTSNPFTNGSLLGGSMINLSQQREGEATVRESINAQRSMLLSEKQAEAAKRESERLGRERQDRAFEQRMRSGELLDAHRDAMRRLQNRSRAG